MPMSIFAPRRLLLSCLAVGVLSACNGQLSNRADTALGTGADTAITEGIAAQVPPTLSSNAPLEVKVVLAGSGSGRVAALSGAIDCGTACGTTSTAGATITFTAMTQTGSVFDGWGGACSGVQPQCTVTVQRALSITASFVPVDLRNQPVDTIIAAMPPNSWKAIAGTQMQELCPQPLHGYYCSSLQAAWSGAAYDERRDRMVVMGGGHGDSFYNNVFVFDLPSMRWTRMSEMPAGVTGDTVPAHWMDIRVETCGFYPLQPLNLPDSVMRTGGYVDPDKCFTEPVVSQLNLQQPRSVHTYGKLFVDRINDRYCYLGGGAAFPGAQAESPYVICFDPHTRTWAVVSRWPAGIAGYGNVARDSAGNVWYLTDQVGKVARYDPVARTWTTFGALNYEAGGGGDIDRQRNHFYALVSKGDQPAVMRQYDLNSPASLNASPPAYTDIAPASTAPAGLGTRPGFVYADAKDRFYTWGGGRNVQVYDPQTRQWSTLAATGDDPGPQLEQGTFGRFRYSPQRNVFVLVNGVSRDVYIYKAAN